MLILYRSYYWLISTEIGHVKMVPEINDGIAALKFKLLNFWAQSNEAYKRNR
jgi:hypothetical protein